MAVDLNFWKYKEGNTHDNDRIYKLACCEGKTMEELINLYIDCLKSD